jgi:hypothetical protein
VFTPVPANQIDPSATGYVLALDGHTPPLAKLWVYRVTRNPATLMPQFGTAREIPVPAFSPPPAATQPDFPSGAAPKIDTLDGRLTQAVQAFDPGKETFSIWTQHTVANGLTSQVRAYQIHPVPTVPVIQRQVDVAVTNSFIYNGSVSPDRAVYGANAVYGDNVVVQFNESSKALGINPRIRAGSSLSGAALTYTLVINGVSPYREGGCTKPTDTCPWGDYSGATPDPRPTTQGRGVVWGTNQYSGLANPPANGDNFRTRIFSIKP